MPIQNYHSQKHQVFSIFRSIIVLAQKYGTPEIVGSLKEAEGNLIQGKLLVVVCGEYKKGKSSLINALLRSRL